MSKENPRLVSLIDELNSVASSDGVGVWREVASRLESPRRNHAEVNISEIERYASEEEEIVVPGKVLGGGVLSKEVTVAAVDFSSSAREKIDRANGDTYLLEEYLEENPDGSEVRVIR